MALKIYNSLTRSLQTFVPLDETGKVVTFYSCGPTVYDDAHIGNFRSFLAADVLRRFLESPLCRLGGGDAQRGVARRVVHVMNITDVGHMTDDDVADGGGEDKMAVAGRRIEEAKKSGKIGPGVEIDAKDPFAVAGYYANRFLEDGRKLGLKVAIEQVFDPSIMPRATAFVPAMVVVIERLVSGGHAYVVGAAPNRVVYFKVTSFGDYGALSGNSLEKLREGQGGRVQSEHQAGKEHPADFMLWKEDAKHIMKWPSPWGWGYPGWHIECSVMSAWRAWLGKTTMEGTELLATAMGTGRAMIDLHSGGEDNVFPHHECELAQSCCAFHVHAGAGGFAHTWFHARHLFVEGMKMSKSKGNFFTARDIFAKGFSAGALRLELIRSHYRASANFTMQGLEDCEKMLARWKRFIELGRKTPEPAGYRGSEVVDAFQEAMEDDLNVSKGLGVINAWLNDTSQPHAGHARVFTEVIDPILGVLGLEASASVATEIGVYVGGAEPSEVVESKLLERRNARAAKDFAASDRIRDELTSMGLAIKDVAGGKVEVSKKR